MKKIHRKIFKYLGWSEKSYTDIYEFLKENQVVKGHGLNYWNFRKGINKLVKQDYLIEIKHNNYLYYKLTFKGIEYLEDMLNEKR